MKLEFDTLHCAKMLVEFGLQPKLAQGLVETLANTDIRNCYSTQEVNAMLPETVQKTLDKYQADMDMRFERENREYERKRAEFKQDLEMQLKRTEDLYQKDRAVHRWVIGTIITVGIALAGYLSALIHLTH